MKNFIQNSNKNENKNVGAGLVSAHGITLIALVITVVILIILAGVAINMTLGDNGIFSKAQQAKRQTEIASIKEDIQTKILDVQAGNEGNISEEKLKEILESYGTLSEEEKLVDKTLTTNTGNYEIDVKDIWNGNTKQDVNAGPTFTTVANAPDVSRV